jgi:hypothetical protein
VRACVRENVSLASSDRLFVFWSIVGGEIAEEVESGCVWICMLFGNEFDGFVTFLTGRDASLCPFKSRCSDNVCSACPSLTFPGTKQIIHSPFYLEERGVLISVIPSLASR